MSRLDVFPDLLVQRRRKDRVFKRVALAATLVGLVALGALILGVLVQGLPWLSMDFLNNFPSRRPSQAGLKAAFYGSLWLISLTTLIAVPIGVAAAIYLEEYAKNDRAHRFLELLIANLAGVPSILYGLLGLIAFVRIFDLFEKGTVFLGIPLPFGRSVLAGALTLALLVLPVLILSTREALRAVPDSLRQAAFGLGATRWQCIRYHVLPAASPGILTGVVLSLSRAFGETAPLIMMGALTYVAFTPENIFDSFTAMPIQIFNWASRPQADFQGVAAAGIIVLLAVLLGVNAIVVALRNYLERKRIS
jgi:phosphate transport system permease protein